jgi:lauroyl/myristoyl acyltransferase
VTWRHILSWKTLFYDALLPALRRLSPGHADNVLRALGRVSGIWSRDRRQRIDVIGRAKSALGASSWDPATIARGMSANTARFVARDYPLDGLSDADFHARFDVQGDQNLSAALDEGRGLILLGSHLGAYLAAVHWLYRREIPLRLLVQRPRHVSHALQGWFDRASDDETHPQSAFFLRRDLPPMEATQRMLRAHSALRQGMAVYLSGDIPWCSTNARRGRLLGMDRTYLAVWTDLAVLSHAPVVSVFCTHESGGRYHLTFDPPCHLAPGDEDASVTRYLTRLESMIRAYPTDAIAHLTWPCYTQ